MSNNDQQLEALYGPLAQHSDHKKGETIRFTEGGKPKSGTIIWITAPGQVVVAGGQAHGVEYIVDTNEGWPSVVRPGDVIE